MNRPAPQAANTTSRADASATAWLALGTPFGCWQDDVVPSLLNRMPALGGAVDDSLTAWLNRGVGDPALLMVDAGAWQLDGARLSHAVPAAWSRRGSGAGQPLRWAVDSRACWVAPTLLEVCVHAGFVVLVDSPVDSLALWIVSDADLNPDSFLDRWCDGVVGLLALEGAPQPHCFVDAAQARRHPSAFAMRLHALIGLPLASDDTVVEPRTIDPLALAVARASVDAHPRCAALFMRLLSVCEMLADEPAALVSALSPLQTGLDAIQVVSNYRRTALGAQSHVKAVARLKELESDAAENERALRDERTRADAQAATLAQAQGELESTRRHNEMLQTQVQQVVDELVFYHAERNAQKNAAAAAPTARLGALTRVPELSTVSLELDEPRDTPPHRELGFVASGVGLRGRMWDTIRGRLVEHHGRPGLVIFGDAGREPLAGWVEAGAEDGHGYMLLIPSDSNSLPGLTRLTAGDWALLSGLTMHLIDALRRRPSSASWLRAATRLHQEWSDMPAAFRYDAVSSTAPADGMLELTFDGAQVGGHELGQVRLGLQFGSAPARDRLCLLRPAGVEVLPWSAWPVEPDGRFSLEWELPLGQAGLRDDKRQAWSGLTQTDRDNLLALLDVLGRLPDDPRAATACTIFPPQAAVHLAAARVESRRAVEVPALRQLARLLRRILA